MGGEGSGCCGLRFASVLRTAFGALRIPHALAHPGCGRPRSDAAVRPTTSPAALADRTAFGAHCSIASLRAEIVMAYPPVHLSTAGMTRSISEARSSDYRVHPVRLETLELGVPDGFPLHLVYLSCRPGARGVNAARSLRPSIPMWQTNWLYRWMRRPPAPTPSGERAPSRGFSVPTSLSSSPAMTLSSPNDSESSASSGSPRRWSAF